MSVYDDELDKKIIKMAKKQPEEALALAKDLVARFSSDARSWISLSYVFRMQKNYTDALNAISNAINIDPSEPANHFDISRIHMGLCNFEGARDSLTQCIELSESAGSLYYVEACYMYRAFCCCKIGQFSSAEKDLEQVKDSETFWLGRLITKDELLRCCKKGKFE